MKTADFVAWLYPWLLRLYPRAFYRRFAREMCADFRDGYAAARRGGARSLAPFLIRGYTDVAVSLVSEWRKTDSFVIWGTSVSVALSIWTGALLVATLEWRHGPASPSFVLQLAVALVVGSTLTIGIALRTHTDLHRS
jgi:hypothetical protein